MTLWNKILVSLKEYNVPLVARENEYVSHQHYTREKWHQDQCTQWASNPTNGIENTENIKSIHFTVTQEHRAGMKRKDHLCLAFNWYPTKSQFIKTVGRKERDSAFTQCKNALLLYWYMVHLLEFGHLVIEILMVWM